MMRNREEGSGRAFASGGRERRAPGERGRGPAAPGQRRTAGIAQLEPRKLPRQARSRATFDAIVDACSQVLASGPYEALTTNSISERAGVSIGTLYEYFPNREAIVAALVAHSCRRLVQRMSRAIDEAAEMTAFQGVEHLLNAGIEALGAQENAFKVLLRDAPFVMQLPAFRQAREALTGLCQTIRMRSGDRLNLPDPATDTWLISQMLFAAMLEIAFLEGPETRTEALRRELAHLTFRMALGREPRADELAPPPRPGFDVGAQKPE